MLLPGWWYAITAESLVDNLDRLPATMELAPAISCPTLFIAGDQEPPEMYPADAFVQKTSGPGVARIIPDCDHFYTGRFDAVAAEVSEWLQATVSELGDQST